MKVSSSARRYSCGLGALKARFCRLQISSILAMQENIRKGEWVDTPLHPGAAPLYRVQVHAQYRGSLQSNVKFFPLKGNVNVC